MKPFVTLDELLRSDPSDTFSNRYQTISDKLNKYVHPEVTKSAISKDGGFLTDHGPEHIRTVIRRASELINSNDANLLSRYEIYILLVAIHLHDVGNAYGRLGHEKACTEIMTWLGNAAGDNAAEKREILKIAQAHGGSINGNKDTIGQLAPNEVVLNESIRPQLLAAILRFSDELSDEKDRASRFLLEKGLLPKESIIYHKYADALHSVIPDIPGREVQLHFELYRDDVTRTFKKRSKRTVENVYLLDEIFTRTIKLYDECRYCCRFMYRYIPIDTVRVTIKIYLNKDAITPSETIGYRLGEFGHPSDNAKDIYTFCPELRRYEKWNDKMVCGKILKRRISS